MSRLTLSLCVYSAKISVKDLNYIELGEKIEPNDKIVAINSNFIHKAYNGFEGFNHKPKKITYYKKKIMATPGYKERKKVGDGSCFSSCLEFVILVDKKPYKMRYFPKSGDLQVFGVTDEKYRSGELVVECFVEYLGIQTDIENVKIISTNLSLLNYRFDVLLPDKFYIDLTKLDNIIRSMRYPPPFHVVFTYDSIINVRKLSVIFKCNGKETKEQTRFILWPNGKANILSAGCFDNASKIYDFLHGIIDSERDNILIPLPIPDSVLYKKNKKKIN